jgi:hypothetical protein
LHFSYETLNVHFGKPSSFRALNLHTLANHTPLKFQ